MNKRGRLSLLILAVTFTILLVGFVFAEDLLDDEFSCYGKPASSYCVQFENSYGDCGTSAPSWCETSSSGCSGVLYGCSSISTPSSCTSVDGCSWGVPPANPICGDGNLDSGEECDDGNQVSGDGCSSICNVEEEEEPLENNIPSGSGLYYHFDGSEKQILYSSPSAPFVSASGGNTISVWIRTEDDKWTLMRSTNDNYNGFNIRHGNSEDFQLFYFKIYDGTANSQYLTIRSLSDHSINSGQIRDGKWHMITAVTDTQIGKIRLYVDGLQYGEATVPNFPNYGWAYGGINKIDIGAADPTVSELRGPYNYEGDIDELRFFHTALNSTQVMQLFNYSRAEGGSNYLGTYSYNPMNGFCGPTSSSTCRQYTSMVSCSADTSNSCRVLSGCGDENIDVITGEQCDDGNNLDGDGCSYNCMLEEPKIVLNMNFNDGIKDVSLFNVYNTPVREGEGSIGCNHDDVTGEPYTHSCLFDGSSKIKINNFVGLPTEVISIGAWIRLNKQKSWNNVFSLDWPNEGGWSMNVDSSGRVNFGVQSSGDRATARAEGVTLNEWHYVVGTYDGNIIKVYLDGVEGTDASIETSLNSEKTLYVGSDTEGYIDEVKVYNKVLSSDEIASNYAAIMGGAGPGTAACSDSDNGKDYTIPGTVTCGTDSFNDVCDGDEYNLTEYYIDENGEKTSSTFDCADIGGICTTNTNEVGYCSSASGDSLMCSPNPATIDKTAPIGQREKSGSTTYYCSLEGSWEETSDTGVSCSNNYECQSNECVSGECYDVAATLNAQTNLLQRIYCVVTNIAGYMSDGVDDNGYQQCLCSNFDVGCPNYREA